MSARKSKKVTNKDGSMTFIPDISYCQHRYVYWRETPTEHEQRMHDINKGLSASTVYKEQKADASPLNLADESVDWSLDAKTAKAIAPAKKMRRVGHAYLLRGYGDCWSSYKRMVRMAKRINPRLRDDDIVISKVTKSSYCQGFSLVQFPVNNVSCDLRDFTEVKNLEFYYA